MFEFDGALHIDVGGIEISLNRWQTAIALGFALVLICNTLLWIAAYSMLLAQIIVFAAAVTLVIITSSHDDDDMIAE